MPLFILLPWHVPCRRCQLTWCFCPPVMKSRCAMWRLQTWMVRLGIAHWGGVRSQGQGVIRVGSGHPGVQWGVKNEMDETFHIPISHMTFIMPMALSPHSPSILLAIGILPTPQLMVKMLAHMLLPLSLALSFYSSKDSQHAGPHAAVPAIFLIPP